MVAASAASPDLALARRTFLAADAPARASVIGVGLRPWSTGHGQINRWLKEVRVSSRRGLANRRASRPSSRSCAGTT
jgi:hypothetical protein